jgi:hypothetical protein
MNIQNLKKICDEFVKRVKECLLRNQFCCGLANEDAGSLKKAFEELLVTLIMEMDENDSLSDGIKVFCDEIKNSTKELTIVLGNSNREQTLEEAIRSLAGHVKSLVAELEKAPVDSNTEFEDIKSCLKTLHDYYSKKDAQGAQETILQVEQHVIEISKISKLDDDAVYLFFCALIY